MKRIQFVYEMANNHMGDIDHGIKIIDELKKVNKMQGVDFTKKMQAIVERYNERNEQDVFNAEEKLLIH